MRALPVVLAGLLVSAGSSRALLQVAPASRALPSALSDVEFWSLSQSLSEPGGAFRSDNLVSNERNMQVVIPPLLESVGRGGVYLGVGPEQNFTYIAALEPRIAFIVDIRRGNRDLHLMYKALFELAGDRAEFVSLLFARPRPDDGRLTPDASADALFAAYEAAAPSEAYAAETIARVREVLVGRHGLSLDADELSGIETVMRSFHRFGPGITYSSSSSGRSGAGTTYGVLMRAADNDGVHRSYLSSEQRFAVVKRLQAANLIVPVVGNFAGPTALRAVGDWLSRHGETVAVFYLSNVEDYLRGPLWTEFCHNVTALPRTERSTFIRSGRGRSSGAVVRGTGAGGTTTTTSRLPDGRLVTLTFIGGINLGGNRLSPMAEDIKPCAVGGG